MSIVRFYWFGSEMRKGRSVEDLDRQRMAELETAFEQSAEEEPEQGMEV